MAPSKDRRSVGRVVAACLVVAMLPGATPVGAVDLGADGVRAGVDDGFAAPDGGAGPTLAGDASGRLVAQVQGEPLAQLRYQADDDDDGEDDDDESGDGSDDGGEDDEEADGGEGGDDSEDDDEGDDDPGDDEEGDEAYDDDEYDDEEEEDGAGDDPISSLVSALTGDSDDDRSDGSGGGDRSGGNGDRDAEGGEPASGGADGDGSGAGVDEQVDEEDGPESVDPSASPDGGEGAVNAAQAETPNGTSVGTTEASEREGFRVENVSVNRSTVAVGEPVLITATVVNGWSTTETREVYLVLFDETVDVRPVTVPSGGARQVTFVRAIHAPGTYEVNVGQASTEVTVTAPEGDASTTRRTGLAGTTDVATPGFTGLAAVLGVLGALLVATVSRRR